MIPAVATLAQAALDRYQSPSIAVAVIRDGRVIDTEAFGYRNAVLGTTATPATRYGIGSLTKQFVAAEILLLEERREITLDQPLRTFFGDGPAADVTVSQLLAQRSGIVDYNTPPILIHDPIGFTIGTITPPEIAKIILRQGLAFHPGTKFEYSNANYLLLGLIVERITGLSLEQALKRDIFTPLGMNDTALADAPWCTGDFACAYTKTPLGVQIVQPWSTHLTYGAGGMYSTVVDLACWDLALMHGSFSPLLRRMIAVAPGSNYGFAQYAYRTTQGRTVAWHDGTVYGFKAMNSMIVPDGDAVIVLTNADYAHAPMIAMQIESAVLAVPGGDNEPVDLKLPRSAYPLALAAGALPLLLGIRGRRWWIPAAVLAMIVYVACVFLL